jgi:hypothetical protein
MKVELLHAPDCPNYQSAKRMLKKVLREHKLQEEIAEIIVTDFAQSEALRFAGSPTIRIDGENVDPTSPERAHHRFSCRVYVVDGKLQGVPSHGMISRAIRSALSDRQTT